LHFAKTRAAANFTGKDTEDEFIILNSISTEIDAKSSDISQRHPVAYKDALTCEISTQHFRCIDKEN